MESVAQPETTTNQKRKMTDMKLEVITVDPKYDLTIIVGSPEQPGGQKAYRINRGSFRNVSAVWAKMLNGSWKEATMSEIPFPDDNSDAFLIVLRIAHFQMSQLPDQLSRQELTNLAILSDKYELQTPIQMVLPIKRWLNPYRGKGELWPASSEVQEFILITYAFGLQTDYKYLVNRAAMEVALDENDQYYLVKPNKEKVLLRGAVPTLAIQEIGRIRSQILSAWMSCCAVGTNAVMEGATPPCNREVCAATKVGVLVLSLKAAGFLPCLSSPDSLRRSILLYWKDLKNTGATLKPYQPCNRPGDGSSYYGRNVTHTTSCSFEACFGDFGIINAAEATLKGATNETLWKEWQKNKIA